MKKLLGDHFFRNLMFFAGVPQIEVERWIKDKWHDDIEAYVENDFCCLVAFYVAFSERFTPYLTKDLLKILFGGVRVTDEGYEFPKSGTALIAMWDSNRGAHQNGVPAALPHCVLKDGMIFDPALENLVPLGRYIRMVENALINQKASNFKILYVARPPEALN